jgi:MFS family permease
MVWRFVQALGASPGLAVGPGVIGDIYKLEERGQAMGIFFGVSLRFPCLRMPFFSEFLGCLSRPCSRSFGRG